MRKHLAFAVLAAFAGSACVTADDPGVSIAAIEADVVFGIEQPTDPVVPANTNVGVIPDSALGAGFDPPAFRNSAADRLPPLREVVESACPKAPVGAAALEPVDVGITGPPREGIYLWQRSGTQIVPVEGQDEPLQKAITGFERRIIRNVQPVDDPFDERAYTFEMVQTLLDRPVVQVRTFLVKPQTQAQVAPGGAVVIDEPRLNESEGGLSLLKVQEYDERDQLLGSFEPLNGLLLLGLPVDPAETFQSLATDPKSGQVIAQDAAVRGRARIDACGDVVDGWRVESIQTRSDVAGEAVYNFLVATQYGGALILEEISTTAVDGSSLNVTFTLGQLDPDPLPEAP